MSRILVQRGTALAPLFSIIIFINYVELMQTRGADQRFAT